MKLLSRSILILFIVAASPMRADTITTLPTTITQDFNTLPASGSDTWTNDSTIPGWYHARVGTGTTIVANDGSSNAGNLYAYGTGTTVERALGSVGSGNAAVGDLFWGILLTNNTGSVIRSLDVSYTGEQWRNSAAAAQTVSFSYLVGTGLTGSLADFQGAGVSVAALDFTSPVTGDSAEALDGNLAANRTAINFTITGLNVASGKSILLRWSDLDHAGADHGLAIDDFSVTVNGSPAVCVPPPPNMVAWWRGDGNADDSVGGHHGSLIDGATFGVGEVGQAFSFNGGSAHVTVPDSPALNPTSQITIDTWVKSTGSGFQGLVGKSRPAADEAYDLGMDGTMVQWRIPNVTPFGLLQVSAAIADGEWHHVAATYDGATMAVYIDGALAGSSSNTGAIGDSDVPLIIGAFQTFDEGIGFSVDGEMDEVELFDRALSGTEIAAIYNAGSAGKCKCTPPPDDMVSWWPAEGNATDIQDGNHGTFVGTPAYTSGEVGQAFDFDGASYVSIPNAANLSITGDITIDAWVRPTANNAFMHIVSKRDNDNSNVTYEFFRNGDETIGFASRLSNSNTFANSSLTVPLNTWSHVAVVISGSDITFYINGVADGPQAYGFARPATTDVLSIGDAHGSFGDLEFWTGQLDEIELFNTALSAQDIAKIYHAGSAGKCRPCTPAPSGMTDWWPGDSNANNIQGFHDGTLHGNTSFAPGKVAQAFSFDGDGDYVDVGDIDLPGTFTIDAWINPADLSSNPNPRIINKTDPLVGASYEFVLRSDGTLGAFVTDGAEDHTSYVTTSSVISTGAWQHVAVTYDGSAGPNQKFLFYVNGTAVPAIAIGGFDSGGSPRDIAEPATIGAAVVGSTASFEFPGLIDEVEVFDRALSDSEILAIYDAGTGGKCKPSVPIERQLVNISTRASVGTGDNVAIGGFILRDDPVGPRLNGGLPKSVLIRALGPSLNVNGTPVPGRLADTVLELHASNGDIITSNDDWGDAANVSDVTATGLAPADSAESAILITLASDSLYTAILRGANDTTGIGLIEVYDLEPTGASHLANISTRGQVLTGDDVLIGGVIVQGGTPVRVMVRGLGPSLNVNGTPVPDRLADPILELHDSNGALIASNDDWGSSPDVAAITTSGLAPDDAKESAILFVPAPGVYTAIVSGGGATPTGVGMVEAYRLGPP